MDDDVDDDNEDDDGDYGGGAACAEYDCRSYLKECTLRDCRHPYSSAR